MSWMIGDNQADRTIFFLKGYEKALTDSKITEKEWPPMKELRDLIKKFEGATEFNRGKEM